ncbi:MAG: metal ABC transporter substrate-binding protein, partial [Pseudomonadota bacterium]|nr:metal ABC transporter substrate-binding protein [Pseudomonadota bacterium]
MPQKITRLAIALSALAIATPAAATNVVASIKPVELLVKAVAGDSVEVSTLVPPGSSPHNYSMKPSQRRALEQADVIFWVGPDMETFLNRLLGGKEFAGRAVAFLESEGGESEHDEHHDEHGHDHESDAHHHDHGDGEDPHIWVDPMLALDMAKDIRNVLSELEGVNPEELNANLERFQTELLNKEQSIRASFAGLDDISLFAYHDAFTR